MSGRATTASARWKQRNKKYVQERWRERRAKQYEWLCELKSAPCLRCKNTFPPCVMEYHHRDPATKAFRIGSSLSRSKESLLAEIAKCDLLCANCHRLTENGL